MREAALEGLQKESARLPQWEGARLIMGIDLFSQRMLSAGKLDVSVFAPAAINLIKSRIRHNCESEGHGIYGY